MKTIKKRSSKNQKKALLSILIISLFIDIGLITLILIPTYNRHEKETEKKNIKKNTTIIVDLKKELSTEFLSDAKVSDFIENINGKLIDDYKIDTSKLGEQTVNFEYVNDENVTIPYSYKIKVKDEVPPVIWLGDTYTISIDYNKDLLDDIVCADNYDDNPKCEIIGNYNTKKVGDYNLIFQAEDASGNKTSKRFVLSVKKELEEETNNLTSNDKIYFKDVMKEYKKGSTKIGIDVSSLQGQIDYEKVKNAGVEFVFIKVGSTKGINGEYVLDQNFINNIRGFNKVNIPVGIYFYSYANSEYAAIRDANWVLEQIKGYKIDLPVAYDWESWSTYNNFNLSFYKLTNSAKSFLDTIKKEGYDGVLYSSKEYLENVWYETGYDVWLADYNKKTMYKNSFKYWQISNNGIVEGINNLVGINIMY